MKNTIPGIIGVVKRAKVAESAGNTTERNELAQWLFLNEARRTVEFIGLKVETYFDKTSRNWVTIAPDDKHEYTGNKADAAVAHLWALYPMAEKCEDVWPHNPKS